ncbi:MAG: AAA family ATPase [Candidatus Accumulibacter sp.]|jgi:ABC-type branched-subunit amino acid transport system ATPase component|nr:AAA family ATPase [Accumulibacter sp.]
MITKLELKNFRGFRDFTLEGIRPITLVAGANNVGKSTLLESLFLFMDRNSSDVFMKLNAFRGVQKLNPSPSVVWETLFTHMDTGNRIVVSIEDDGQTQSLTLGKDEFFSLSSVIKAQSRTDAADLGMPIYNSYPLETNYECNERKEVSHFVLSEKGIALHFGKSVHAPTKYVYYMGGNIIVPPHLVAEFLSQIDLAGKHGECIDALKILEQRIKDVSVVVIGGIGGVYADLGEPKKFPLNVLGGGVNKLMQIVATMLANPGSIFLVDEIENGFHYSFFPALWKIIGKLAAETRCQFFATTHSYECISGARDLATGDPEGRLFRFVRLDKQGETVVPRIFENDSFDYAIQSDLEVR